MTGLNGYNPSTLINSSTTKPINLNFFPINHSAQSTPIFANVEQTLKDAQAVLRNVDSQIDPLAGSIKRTSDDARKLVNNVNQRVKPIQADLAKTTKSLRSALETAEGAIEEMDGIVSENSEFRYQLDIFLREITLMARSLRSFADYLERNPDALIRGKQRREGQK